MTTKQAADIIKMLLGYLKGEIEPPKQETIEEAKAFEQQGYECLEIAIKALEKKPCDDCISRQAVNDLVDELARAISDERLCMSRGRSTATIMQDILDLPPVTPKEKTGKWIRTTDDHHDYYECEHCGIAVGLDDIKNYCPNCGARMVSE